jgi:hypothetical protein
MWSVYQVGITYYEITSQWYTVNKTLNLCVVYLLRVNTSIYTVLCIAQSDNFSFLCFVYWKTLKQVLRRAPQVCRGEGGQSSGRPMKSVPKMEVKIMIWPEHLAVTETMVVVASEMPGVSSRAPAIVIFWQPRSTSPTVHLLYCRIPWAKIYAKKHSMYSVFHRACIMSERDLRFSRIVCNACHHHHHHHHHHRIHSPGWALTSSSKCRHSHDNKMSA